MTDLDPSALETESPQMRRHRAAALRTRIAAYRDEIPTLEQRVSFAERVYAQTPGDATWARLASWVRDLVAAQLAMEFVGQVAREIAAGTIDHDREDPREFEARVRVELRRARARIAARKPQQMAFGW